MAKRSGRAKQAKKVPYRFIEPTSEIGAPMYRLLRELVDAHHEDLRDAKIALAWNLAWKADLDGRVTLGQCRRLSDLERELFALEAFDFVIVLREAFWMDLHVAAAQRRALLDHELCHAAITIGGDGEPVVDERGRLVYRTRKHDIEEFAEIADRHGCWKKDLEYFAHALDRARDKVGTTWVSYSSLREELVAVGLTIPIDVIVTWTDDERREARTWAILRREFPLTADAMPAHIAAVTTSTTPLSVAQ